jgi:hypothetical protein
MYHDPSWGVWLKEIGSSTLGLYVFMLVWDVIDGASRKLDRDEKENARVLAEGWKRWHAGDWMMK